jgi:WD40 repeat protein
LLLVITVTGLSCGDDDRIDLPEVMNITPQISHLNTIKHSTESSDGKYIATTDYTHIIIHNKTAQTILHRLPIPTGLTDEKVKTMAFSRDNAILTTYISDYKLEYSLKTSSLIAMSEHSGETPKDSRGLQLDTAPSQSLITALSISPDKDHMVTADNDGWIRIWDIFQAEITSTIRCKGKPITAIKLNPLQQTIQAIDQSAIYYEWDISDITSPKPTIKTKLIDGIGSASTASISGRGHRILIATKHDQPSTLTLLERQDDGFTELGKASIDKPIRSMDMDYEGDTITIVFEQSKPDITGISILDASLTGQAFIDTPVQLSAIRIGDDGYVTAVLKDGGEIWQYHPSGEPMSLPFNTGYPVTSFDYCENVFIMLNLYGELIMVNSLNPPNSFNLTFNQDNQYYIYSTIDGVFNTSDLSLVRGVKWLDMLPESEWVDLYDPEEIEGRLVEYMGLVSDW